MGCGLCCWLQKDQKGGRGATKLPGLVLPLAAAKLAEALGLEMLTLERPAGGQQAARAAAGGREPLSPSKQACHLYAAPFPNTEEAVGVGLMGAGACRAAGPA